MKEKNGINFYQLSDKLEFLKNKSLTRDEVSIIVTALRKYYDEPIEPECYLTFIDKYGEKVKHYLQPEKVERKIDGGIVEEYRINDFRFMRCRHD